MVDSLVFTLLFIGAVGTLAMVPALLMEGKVYSSLAEDLRVARRRAVKESLREERLERLREEIKEGRRSLANASRKEQFTAPSEGQRLPVCNR